MKLFFRSDGKRYINVRSAGMNRKKNMESRFFQVTEKEVKFDIGDIGALQAINSTNSILLHNEFNEIRTKFCLSSHFINDILFRNPFRSVFIYAVKDTL